MEYFFIFFQKKDLLIVILNETKIINIRLGAEPLVRMG